MQATDDPSAAQRLTTLRERFAPLRRETTVRFERFGERLRTTPAAPAVSRPAKVDLPASASGEVQLTDATSNVRVRFRLRATTPSRAATADGYVVYEGAVAGGDLVHRVHAEGTEDYVAFDTRPAREELAYDVDVSDVAGLRLARNVLEFLDRDGTPSLRISPPYVVDALGSVHDARLSVDGCRYDTNAAPPWGRAVTRPAAEHCTVRLAWGGASDQVVYPALVDPTWVSTGSMVVARYGHAATLLANGRVLIAGGEGQSTANPKAEKTAELFDPSSGTFALTASGFAELHGHGILAVAFGSGALVIGGASSTAVAYLFDSSAGTLTPTAGAPLANRVSGFTATAISPTTVLVVGGPPGSKATEIYDKATNQFTAGPMTTFARSEHTATVLASGKVLVAGDGSAEVYDPTTKKFAATGSMVNVRYQHTATLLPSGKVLVAGGQLGDISKAQSEIFDPAGVGSFSAGPKMVSVPRWHQAAPFGTNGLVLLIGDYNATAPQIFDPAANAGAGSFFAGPTNISMSRRFATATTLVSGRVLVAGGGDSAVNYLSTAATLTAANGDVCGAGAYCVSGNCVDGVCCNTACDGACDRCNLAGKVGTCSAATAGDPGSPACATYACDGVGAACATTCASDTTCATGFYCDSTGKCVAQKAQAAACNPQTACKQANCRECASGNCADGVCCNSACNSPCDRCDLGGGSCKAVAAGDPGVPACPAPFACNGTSTVCPSNCTSDSDCGTTAYCGTDGICQAGKPQGATCKASTDCKSGDCRMCASGSCVDGVCCDTACNSACLACTAALKQSGADDGKCGPAKEGTNPHKDACPLQPAETCHDDGLCNGLGACRAFYPKGTSCGVTKCIGTRATGELCTGAGDCKSDEVGVECAPFMCTNGGCTKSCTTSNECAATAWCNAGVCETKRAPGETCTTSLGCDTGSCADGVCCDRACAGQCEACDVVMGTCTTVTGAPHGARPACAAGLVCGEGSAVCHEPPATAATCDGDHTTRSVDGKTADCSPYKCDSNGTCRTQCVSVSDCIEPSVCDGTKCVAPNVAPTTDGGCGMTPSSHGSPLALLVIALGAAARRRSRKFSARAA